MNPSIQKDLKQLEGMLANYNKLATKLESSELSHPECQILQVSLFMLKDFMSMKTQEIKRRLRESGK